MKQNIKYLALLLALIMLFSTVLTACQDPISQGNDSTETTANQETEATDTEDVSGDSSETPSETEELPSEATETDEVTTEPVETETEYWDERFDESYAPVLYYSAHKIYNVAKPGEFGVYKNLDEVKLAADNSYTRLIAYPGEKEAYFNLISEKVDVAPYVAIKYRTRSQGVSVEMFMDSVNTSAVGSSCLYFPTGTDGYWNLAVMNVSEKISAFNGKTINYLRFDFLNAASIPENAYLDVAYIAFFESAEDAKTFEYGEDYVEPQFTIDPSSGYYLSEIAHATCLDMVNGIKVAGGMGGDIAKGAEIIANTTLTVGENILFISGWTVVEGGMDKIVWSVDGGKTWNDGVLYGRESYGNGGDAHIGVAESRIKSHGGSYTFQDKVASYTGCNYQGTANAGIDSQGVMADLSDYVGQTVSLAFCAVSKSDPKALCPIVFFETVRVGMPPEEDPDEGIEDVEESVEIPVTDFSDSITEAGKLSNTVNVYFDDADRSSLTVENNEVTYVLDLTAGGNQQIVSLTGKNGGVFLQNTSDAFVKAKDGTVYYTSKTKSGASTNIYRQGFYYYDVHVYGADFLGEADSYENSKTISLKGLKYLDTEVVSDSMTSTTFKVTGTADPRVYITPKQIKAVDYQFLSFSMKTTNSTGGQIFIMTSGMSGYSADMCVEFRVIADGEWHDYLVPISTVPNYQNSVTGIRLDIGSKVGEEISIKDLCAVGTAGLPSFGFDRSLYVYSDKVNQVMHLITPSTTSDIDSYGWQTSVPSASVVKLIVGDKNGDHTSLDGVDWASAKYVAFDIKNVGVLGYILLDHEGSGALSVALTGGNYVITQAVSPADGTVAAGTEIYMGHRLYTKEGIHTFDDFLFEAFCEYNPLEGITTLGTSRAYRYVEYDALRGAYKFEVKGGDWNTVFLNSQNKHYDMIAQIKGEAKDRKIYIYTSGMGNAQTLECAVMLDGNGIIVPIDLEVCKNFTGDGEENKYLADIGYSEVIFPLVIKANSNNAFNMVHLYQNWGKYPLKQIDSIQFYAPFYHLSTGVTETNCIRPWYDMNAKMSLYTLPDFRAMSATLWMDIFKESNGQILSNQPQHTNGGNHQFLQYTDSEGNTVYSENIRNFIDSYGPTYAEIDMDYITDDGKIKVTYKHLEMPQTDENRTYYEIKYEFLGDLTINNVLEDFTFYTVAGRNMNYQHVGYLNENNESVIINTNTSGSKAYVLGDECPYFSMFEFKETVGTPDLDQPEKNYVNLGCLIYNYDVKIGGQAYNGNLAIKENGRRINLTLNIDGKVTFKKGDTITLNMILVPWGDGYGMTDYNRADTDWNVREIRENSLLEPFKITVANGTKVESVFMPKVKSTDGKSAEFTISGGENNVTVRVYGMKKIARPVIYEKVNGEWVVYEVCSLNTPDSTGNAHDYDGYMIHYDEDGTYSYSFVTTITDGAARTFKIVVE
ncbi:MAG: hypothetical protein IJY39_14500 [Clostridia bacterium]|nr:hypothetical protein [Clostridia bacterium]